MKGGTSDDKYILGKKEQLQLDNKIKQAEARIERVKNKELAEIIKQKNRLIYLIGSSVFDSISSKDKQNHAGFNMTKENLKEILDSYTLAESDRIFLAKIGFLSKKTCP